MNFLKSGNELGDVATVGRSSTRVLDALLSERLRRAVTRQTDAAPMAQFGISYNTWRKLRAGNPIRTSVADRLEQRFG